MNINECIQTKLTDGQTQNSWFYLLIACTLIIGPDFGIFYLFTVQSLIHVVNCKLTKYIMGNGCINIHHGNGCIVAQIKVNNTNSDYVHTVKPWSKAK